MKLINTMLESTYIWMKQKKEIEDVKEATGKLPFEYLEDIGFLNSDVLAAHGVWLSKEEIEIIKKRDVKISHNPCSNMKLASGIAPVQELLSKKCMCRAWNW